MTTFVLIPGAGGAAWYWSRVVAQLRADGHEAIAVDLPADDERAGLAEYAQLVSAAASGRGPVHLVAQSLGGFTAPMAAELMTLEALTLINAMIPLPGETANEWWGATRAVETREAAAEAGGYGPFDVETYFFHDIAPEVFAEGADHQRDEAEAAFASVCAFADWPDVPIRVLAGEDDRFFPLMLQRAVARDRLGIDVDALPGGHLISLSQPVLVSHYLTG